MDFGEYLISLLEYVSYGVSNFVDFVISLPALIVDIVEFIPYPLKSILPAFLSFIILVILIKFIKLLLPTA